MGSSSTSALSLLQLGLVGSILYIVTCQPDIVEYTCFSYRLRGGINIRCNSTEVFSPVQKRCILPQQNKWPCDIRLDCTSNQYHKFADVKEGCNTYYTCFNGLFFGHNYCPDGLIFNEHQQYCDWVYNVPPPCGTADFVLG